MQTELTSVHTLIGPQKDVDNLKERLEKSLQLKDSQNTVTSRALLAQEYVKASADQTRACESLIYDQHLQHQVPYLPHSRHLQS